MMERTLVMLKPDAVVRGHIGNILSYFERAGLKIIALKMRKLTESESEIFYAEHEGRPFFHSLVDDMSADPIVTLVLEGEDAIKRTREIMGATDPKEADQNTIRKDFAVDKGKNSVHGSDSPESALREIPFYFSELDVLQYERT